MIILFYLAIGFLGFAIGRVGHILAGHLKAPHHWIYGLILIIISVIFPHISWTIYLGLFGVGLFISDFKDFWLGRFYGADDVKIKKFWGID